MSDPFKSDDIQLPPTADSPAYVADQKPLPVIPGYEFIRVLKRAGQGVVYLANQESTHRAVAIKMLRDDRPVSESALRRFQREVRLLAQLKHPNIVIIFDSGTTADGRRYYVMEYVHGQPLHEYFQGKKLSLTSTVALFLTVCRAVAAAHFRGIVHHDLKPSNILVEGEGIAKLLDFGLARVLSGPADILDNPSGRLPGTLPYMSPEQTHGEAEDIDTRSDVYALGVMFYEILTGQHPYPAFPVVDFAETLNHIRHTTPMPPSQAWTAESGVRADSHRGGAPASAPIDSDLDFIVQKALAKDRDHRQRDADELSESLDCWLRDEPIPPRRDDFWYLLKKRIGRLVGRHVLIAHSMVALLVFSFAWVVGDPIINKWTNANAFYLKQAFPMTRSVEIEGRFPHVTVVALRDATNVEDLARAESIEGVTSTFRPSLRRLHGRFMEKLVGSRCRALVWDITFTYDTEYDSDFVAGAKKLLHTGVDVIVCLGAWPMDDPASLAISSAIASTARIGSAGAGLGADLPWVLPLVVQRGSDDAVPSLALRSYAAARRPGAYVDWVIRAEDSDVDLLYWIHDAQQPSGKRGLGENDRIDLSEVAVLDEEEGELMKNLGLTTGDTVGFFPIDVPTNDILDASTVFYEDVFSADASTLRLWFADRVVVVGDPPRDQHPHPDGRELGGCYAHATAIDRLLTDTKRVPRGVSVEWPLGVAVALGIVVGWTGRPRLKRRLSVAFALSLFAVGTSLFFSWKYGYLSNPLVPIMALWIASECSAVVERVARPRVI